MDILTHTLSGVAIGTVIASFSKNRYSQKLGIVFFAAFGVTLPDIDAISLWSGFDSIIGKFLGLNNTGAEIYYSKFWYSHHAFMHSLFASFIISLSFIVIYYLIQSRFRNLSINEFVQSLKNWGLLAISFISGFAIHLIEDMPTPASVWGGVNFFWPAENYIGGTGHIWWWNNYDIFLIVIAVIMLNVLTHALSRFIRTDKRIITTIIFIIGFSLSVFQIHTRGFDFNYTGHTDRYQEFELKSKEIQKRILGEGLYEIMNDFDNKLGVHF